MAESLAHLRNASSSELVSEAYWLKEILPVSFREVNSHIFASVGLSTVKTFINRL